MTKNVNKKHIDSYKAAGVNIDAGNEAVSRIKEGVKSTFSPAVLADIGSFGALYDLKAITDQYNHPVLVQSIDGVGTKIIVARLLNNYRTIGIDLLSACCNDIVVMGAKPLTFLDYIANDCLSPDIIADILDGMVKACREIDVSLVGGEIAEMPDTYLPGEHDLVGIVTGVVEKERIVNGFTIEPGNAVLGLPSSGLHTNGYSLARKLFFTEGGFSPQDSYPGLVNSIGETLLEPHINYTLPVQDLLNHHIDIRGMAHISGGGLVENIPRILPTNCSAEIHYGSWPELPVFAALRELGGVSEKEMFRTFNMGIGLVLITPQEEIEHVRTVLTKYGQVYTLGQVVPGNPSVVFSGQPDA